MVKAVMTMKDGRKALVLGLSDANIEMLKEGHPIYFDLATLRVKPEDVLGAVTVFHGRTEAAMAVTLHEFIGPDTEVIGVPKGDPRPM